MAGINKVIIVGFLGNDPEIRTMPNGEQVATDKTVTLQKFKVITYRCQAVAKMSLNKQNQVKQNMSH